MRIGVVSDTHSRYQTVARVVKLLGDQQVDLVLHCGDIEDAETVRLFGALNGSADQHKVATHFVFGNCDTERDELLQSIHECGCVLHEPFGDLELDGRKLAWTHGDAPRLLQDLERSGHFDFIFYGHSHRAEQHRQGPSLIVNPGALHRARVKTFVVLDLDTSRLESIVVA
jgi:putative phosphoesterase